MKYQNKLVNALQLAKSYAITNSFLLIKDHEGWTDCFMADLTGLNVEVMKAKATICQGKLTRYKTDRETCPEIKNIIPEGGVEVIDLTWNLEGNFLGLVAGELVVYIDPKYLKYFNETYKKMGGISKITITDKLQGVKVYVGDDIVGLIMPVRV